MLLESLRQAVLETNLQLVSEGLVFSTFGNASGIDREKGLVVIKPSGVRYDALRARDLVILDLGGRQVEGELNPSSDLPTHLVLYRAFSGIGGIVHTHAGYSSAWAQAGREIPCFGTTHADCICGPVPITDAMKPAEIQLNYEANTGHVIVRRFAALDPASTPAVLVHGHGPFCWGPTPEAAVKTAVMLEEIARVAWLTVSINPAAEPISQVLLDKHFQRKHGPKAYYGQ
jgi:L-ribulose-5-phosphate 4-epimerase